MRFWAAKPISYATASRWAVKRLSRCANSQRCVPPYSKKAEEAEAIAQPAAPQAAKMIYLLVRLLLPRPNPMRRLKGKDDFVEPVLQPEAEKGEELGWSA